MSQTYSDLNYHLIFGTKERRPTLSSGVRQALCEYLGGTVKGHGGHPIEINAVADHAHLLVRLPPTVPLSDLIRGIKASSSKWLNDTKTRQRSFGWQDGDAAFTVSHSLVGRVTEYVRSQEEHHRVKTYREELIELLQKAGIEYDPRYLD